MLEPKRTTCSRQLRSIAQPLSPAIAVSSLQFKLDNTTHPFTEEGLIEMKTFGATHTDKKDAVIGLTGMLVVSDLPDDHEPGRLHLPGLGIYVELNLHRIVFFSGRRVHGGTPPLAPRGQDPPKWAARCMVVCYPSGAYVNGVVRQCMAAVPCRKCKEDIPLYLSPEMVGIK